MDGVLAELGTVVAQRPFAYATSWPIEEVVVQQPGGESLTVLVKRLEGAVQKPAGFLDPAREAVAYRLVGDRGIPTPRCYASGPGWLVLEAMPGTPLWQSGDVQDWCRAARWAAELHQQFATDPPPREHLLVHDRRHFQTIVARAGVDGDLASAAGRAAEIVTALPVTLVHGELYPANLLVDREHVVAVDWEMAAVGSGVIDLAALTTGFDPDRAAAVVDAYGGCPARDLAAARLLLALQWLGWGPDWQPPAEHRRDWLAEARIAAEAVR
jgi:hypothetical protein